MLTPGKSQHSELRAQMAPGKSQPLGAQTAGVEPGGSTQRLWAQSLFLLHVQPSGRLVPEQGTGIGAQNPEAQCPLRQSPTSSQPLPFEHNPQSLLQSPSKMPLLTPQPSLRSQLPSPQNDRQTGFVVVGTTSQRPVTQSALAAHAWVLGHFPQSV